ncbi:MAG: PLP-dependent aminotransferase family protein, partial [Planctomycetales bacterium]|nr:PLP-dependent aminotransferase family protein [Planctomycetales bacterium]
ALERLQHQGDLPRVKALYIVSDFDNPRGVTTSAARRQAIMDIIFRWSDLRKIFVVEDAAYRELRYEGEDIPSIRSLDERGDTVVLAGTFSKSFSPGLRTGWGLVPKSLVPSVRSQKDNIDFGSPNFSQQLLWQVIRQGRLDHHVQTLRDVYRAKRDVMHAAMLELLAPDGLATWQLPDGGLYIWAEIPEPVDTGTKAGLFDLAIEEGMLYIPGEYFYPSRGVTPSRQRMRLSFGVQTASRIRTGIDALGRALRRVCVRQ